MRVERPVCSEVDFHSVLIEAIGNGDHSAIEMLRQQRNLTANLGERLRLDAALLGRVRDDRPYFDELREHAANAVGLPEVGVDAVADAKLYAWCRKRGFAPLRYDLVALKALRLISSDDRARPLLDQALASGHAHVIAIAIGVLGMQHRVETLPKIEEALLRLPSEQRWWPAYRLIDFRTEAADQLALRFLDETGHEIIYAWEREADPLR
ncbi:MAG: hypothetical protein JWO56_3251 [Acidobacteria bacterium]|nr:hypothetical protein [Acidobacteriota bacterium]